MANGNNNSGEFFDSYGLRALFEKISQNLEGREETLASNAMSQQILKVFTDNVKDVNKLTEKEIEKVGKVFLTELRAMFGGSNDLTSYMKTMVELLKDMAREGNLTAVQGANRVNSTFANLVYASENTKRAGGDPIINRESKKAKGSQEAQEFYSTYLPEGVKKTNSILEKFLSFWNAEKSGEKTKRRQFIEDLADGLGKSKWVGGAIMDLIKLASYFAANWLKQFGPIGKALAVGVIALAPILGAKIGEILIKGMSNLLWSIARWSVTGIWNLFKGILNPATWAKAFSVLGKGASLIGRGLGVASRAVFSPAGLGIAAGVGSMVAGISNIRQGGARNATAGASQIIGGIAFALAPFLGPLAPMAVAVGVIANGIGLIIKHWKAITGFFEKILEKLGILTEDENGKKRLSIPNFITNTIDDANYAINAAKSAMAPAQLLEGKTTNRHLDKSKFTKEDWERASTLPAVYGPSGEIRNLGQMTQKHAAEVIKKDIEAHKSKGTQSYYEFIPKESKLVKHGAFRTDIADEAGVYMVRGFSDWYSGKLKKAEEMGYDVSNAGVTSGLGSLGSPEEVSGHTYSNNWTGHFSSVGRTYDIPILRKKGTGERMSDVETKRLFGFDFYQEEDVGGANEHGHGAIRWAAPQAKIETKSSSIKVSEAKKESAEKPAENKKEEATQTDQYVNIGDLYKAAFKKDKAAIQKVQQVADYDVTANVAFGQSIQLGRLANSQKWNLFPNQ